MSEREVLVLGYWNGCIKYGLYGVYYEGPTHKKISVKQKTEFSRLVDGLYLITGLDKSRSKFDVIGRYPVVFSPNLFRYVHFPVVNDTSLKTMLEVPSIHPSINIVELYLEVKPVCDDVSPSAACSSPLDNPVSSSKRQRTQVPGEVDDMDVAHPVVKLEVQGVDNNNVEVNADFGYGITHGAMMDKNSGLSQTMSRKQRKNVPPSTSRGLSPRHMAPWPRGEEEGQKFVIAMSPNAQKKMVLDKTLADRRHKESWDDYDSIFYNAWHDVKLEPTRFADETTFRDLGLLDDLKDLLKNAGLGGLATRSQPLYPDYVRQFMASVQVYYEENENATRAANGRLTYRICGVRHTVTFDDIAEIYGLRKGTKTEIPSEFDEVKSFWDLFGFGKYDSSSSTVKDIRHPVLRSFVRLVGESFCYMVENSKARLGVLIVLYYALAPYLEHLEIKVDTDIHFGAVFAHTLADLKYTPLKKTSNKPIRIGSLLTPFFHRNSIDLTATDCIKDYDLLDDTVMRNSKWLQLPNIWIYRISQQGPEATVILPHPNLMGIGQDVGVLQFRPDLGHGQGNKVPLPEQHDDQVQQNPHEVQQDQAAPTLIGYPPEPNYTDQEACNRYIAQMQRRMWRALQSGVCSGILDPIPPSPPPNED